MRGLNKVMLIGHLGKDPEIQTFEGGKSLAKFSIATTETYKDKTGARQEKTEWHNIVLWGVQAEIAQKYLRKGSLVYLEGKINTREYEKDGTKKYFTEIVGESFTMLDRKEGGGNPQASGAASQPVAASMAPSMDDAADDLPF